MKKQDVGEKEKRDDERNGLQFLQGMVYYGGIERDFMHFWEKCNEGVSGGFMGEKSEQKRMFIIETARKVFMEKGYKRVTMKDIVEACEISRGGLYLYFGNTAELFQEVMKMESNEADDVFSDHIKEDATATDILLLFLQEQKKELLRGRDNLIQATYEYYFDKKTVEKDDMIKRQSESAIMIIRHLLESGVESEEFFCEDCDGAARNIMLVLEGLKITAQTVGISEEQVDVQISYIMGTLGVEI